MVPIAYGYPGPEMMDEAEAGRVILGGCIVDDDSPVLACSACNGTQSTDATLPRTMAEQWASRERST